MASSATRELLAPREDVWGFLAEPNHLLDWWPGILGVVPDHRGFAPGARWQVRVRKQNVFTGRTVKETLLLIREIDLYERWSWHLVALKLDVEIRVRAAGEHTIVTCTTSGRRHLAETALRRLYDLCQTAASL
jgi:uncharacterized protein YndB with AHSA1/START domain